MYDKKEEKYLKLIIGIAAILYGISLIFNIIKNLENFGLEVAYTQLRSSYVALPLLFPIGLILGGLYVIYSVFKKPKKKK